MNVALMIFSSVTLLIGLKPILRIHSRMFELDEPDLKRAYFQYLAQFKIVVLVFNVVPYIALKLIG